jgi:hypothetical protein
MPSFTVKSRWGDQTQQGGGEADFAAPGGRGAHEGARIGIDVKEGSGDVLPRDFYAREADRLTVDVAQGGETETMTLRQASAATNKEYGVMYYSDSEGTVKYRIFEGKSLEPDSLNMTWDPGEKPLAFLHTHPNQDDTLLWFSMGDVRSANSTRLPVYAMSAFGSDTLVCRPGITPTSGTVDIMVPWR